jgi:ribosomal protein S18 acetylase RimI-like enzyme
MNDVVCRRAGLHDAERLVEFAKRTYSETFSSVNTPENMQAYLSSAFTATQFQSDLCDSHVKLFIAEIDRQLAAYAKLVEGRVPECIKGERPVELERFYVDSAWQGKGVASTLIQRCFDEAKCDGFKTIYLGVWEHNLRAQAFYRKWNFVRAGEHIFQMGNDPQVDWWMVRPL